MRTLILDVWEYRVEGYAEADGFQFPLTFIRGGRTQLLSPTERTAAAQKEAVRTFPELTMEGSKLHREFMTRLKTYKAENPSYFDVPEWPLNLARDCMRAIANQ